MNKKVENILKYLVILLLPILFAFGWGYGAGFRQAKVKSNPYLYNDLLVSYVDDVWYDCQALERLRRGDTQSVIRHLEVHLPEQYSNLKWIEKSVLGPNKAGGNASYHAMVLTERYKCPASSADGGGKSRQLSRFRDVMFDVDFPSKGTTSEPPAP